MTEVTTLEDLMTTQVTAHEDLLTTKLKALDDLLTTLHDDTDDLSYFYLDISKPIYNRLLTIVTNKVTARTTDDPK